MPLLFLLFLFFCFFILLISIFFHFCLARATGILLTNTQKQSFIIIVGCQAVAKHRLLRNQETVFELNVVFVNVVAVAARTRKRIICFLYFCLLLFYFPFLFLQQQQKKNREQRSEHFEN